MAIPFLLWVTGSAQGQSSPSVQLGLNAVPLYTWVDPLPGGRSLAEIRLVQPTIMVHAGALANRLRLLTTINLEGWTMPQGELAPGDWGEGFVDRRHPHTYLHEAMLMWDDVLGRGNRSVRVSLSAGKGFAPFGTDDPMSRPPLRYPVNHHVAQILERAVAILGVRAGPVMVEGGLFNGDEPERPGQWPLLSRFGDSWSGRITLLPLARVELQGSHAEVKSPEHRPGFGTDQSKWSLAARWSGLVRRSPVYGLVEWARTSEAHGFFLFHSVLAEGAWTRGHSRLHYRFERTERPEEERTLSPFRSLRPHLENSILGTTRWTIQTLGYSLRVELPRGLQAEPLVEVSYGHVADVNGGLFDAATWYGKTSFWSLSVGARLTLGMPLHRMGRYGVAQDTAPGMNSGHHGQHEHSTDSPRAGTLATAPDGWTRLQR